SILLFVNTVTASSRCIGTSEEPEEGHGKGAPDGVGGLIKRTADKHVAYGNDISDAAELFKYTNESNIAVKLFYITSDMITKIDEEISNVVTIPVKGTMLIHQVICSNESECMKVVLVKSYSNEQGVILGSAISSNSAIGGSSTSCIRTESADHISTNDVSDTLGTSAEDDIFKYDFHDVMTEFEGMESVTSRHMQLPLNVWD
ncbi:hypothetical protein MAR_010292, partial [Mya arenaria]